MIDQIMEIDAETGSVIIRPMTETEITQRDIDKAKMKEAEQAAIAKAAADAAARRAAIDHAKSLGFTDAMIAVMYPNLGIGDATE